MPPIVEFNQISKSFTENKVLVNLDLTIEENDFMVMYGMPSSGKSVLLRLLMGLEKPDAGAIRMRGLDSTSRPPKDRNLGYVPQDFALFPQKSIFENIAYPLRLGQWTSEDIRETVEQAARMLDIEDLLQKLPTQLSGGQKQRLALAASTLHQPELLFLDEPTSAVDPENRRAFWESLFDLIDEGTTILVSTHYMDEAERCHAIAILDLGVLVAAGSPDELADDIQAQVLVVESRAPREVSKLLERQSFVHSTAQIGNTLRVMVDRDLEGPEAVTSNAIRRAGLVSERCEKDQPNLEDVFVAATQARKAQRDEAT